MAKTNFTKTTMKTKYYFLAVLAVTVLAACTSDEIAIVTPPQEDPALGQEGAIMFSSLGRGITRADFTGVEAADKLGRKFVVAGKKGSSTASTEGQIAFDNYLVEYAENTAGTTESNSANWEYAGKGPIKHAADHGIVEQTIKYWDYSKPQYDFIAWSTGSKTAIYEGTPRLHLHRNGCRPQRVLHRRPRDRQEG